MKKNSEIIDGLSIATWKQIEKITLNYPKPIRFIEGTQSRIHTLNFYLTPLQKDGRAPIESMEAGRMLTIAYKIYKESNGDVTKDLSLKIINKIIN